MTLLSGNAFIFKTYEEILGRVPDPVGLSHYSKMLSNGASKLQIISDLANSEEGKSRCKLSKEIKKYQLINKLKDVPVFGKILFIMVFLWNIDKFLAEIRVELEKLRREDV
jgi:uncharacterized membrane protein